MTCLHPALRERHRHHPLLPLPARARSLSQRFVMMDLTLMGHPNGGESLTTRRTPGQNAAPRTPPQALGLGGTASPRQFATALECVKPPLSSALPLTHNSPRPGDVPPPSSRRLLFDLHLYPFTLHWLLGFSDFIYILQSPAEVLLFGSQFW
ncbi:hypothetical protein BV22DRAFT_657695 [Leucogyrophana mollusca]|uniref:Uncharacterized protein n=1 Tax=Leucogyrophana mollusca TaxID=85980 RepID=A0ACB8BAB5_9AGAM|nr:hypothetical protein BV22DRAFT_657695 [Leucogyrophana mollusca]